MNRILKLKKLFFFLIILHSYVIPHSSSISFDDGMYFATASATEHFPWLQGLIESIQKYEKAS